MAAVAAFEAIDANHDGVITEQEFVQAAAPVTYVQPATYVVEPQPMTYVVEPQPVTYTTAPESYVTYDQYLQPPESYVTYDPYITYDPYATAPTIVLTAGTRVVYTSRSNGQKYPGVVLERSPMGWLLQLDVDGGVKEVEDIEIWRVELEEEAAPAATEASSPAKAVKSKKIKKSSKKGCC